MVGGENAWRSVGSVFVDGAAAGTCYKQIAQAVESQTPMVAHRGKGACAFRGGGATGSDSGLPITGS
jgi:hypothetical protein